MGNYALIENNLKNLAEEELRVLEQIWGIEIYVYRNQEDIATEVYGIDAGARLTDAYDTTKITGILVGDDFFAADAQFAGTFQEGWLYTLSDYVEVNDIVAPKRFDDVSPRDRKYKVEKLQSLGMTTSIMKRFRLSALG